MSETTEPVPPIYTVTSVCTVRNRYTTRCWGWYPNKADALAAVLANSGDLEERSYNYVVVEQVGPGILGIIHGEGCFEDRRWWFRWEEGGQDSEGNRDGKWVPSDCPEDYKQVVGFGMG